MNKFTNFTIKFSFDLEICCPQISLEHNTVNRLHLCQNKEDEPYSQALF